MAAAMVAQTEVMVAVAKEAQAAVAGDEPEDEKAKERAKALDEKLVKDMMEEHAVKLREMHAKVTDTQSAATSKLQQRLAQRKQGVRWRPRRWRGSPWTSFPSDRHASLKHVSTLPPKMRPKRSVPYSLLLFHLTFFFSNKFLTSSVSFASISSSIAPSFAFKASNTSCIFLPMISCTNAFFELPPFVIWAHAYPALGTLS